MPYSPRTDWKDDEDGGTPILATDVLRWERGIAAAASTADAALGGSLGTPGGAAQPVDKIASYGDSLTASTGANWPGTTLADALGCEVVNMGQSGWASSDIALRQGGLMPTFRVTSGTLNAVGSTPLTLLDPPSSWRQNGTGSLAWTGILALGDGIPGQVIHNMEAQTWAFNRTTAGSAIAAPSPVLFRGTQGDPYAAWIQTLWVGRNNIGSSTPPVVLTDAVRDIDLMVRRLTPVTRRYVVLGVTNSRSERSGTAGYDAIVAVNQYLARRHPGQFLDIRRYLIDSGLADAGITPTSTDLADIAQDRIPLSLMVGGSDTLHLNATGYRLVGQRVADFIAAKGWIVGALPKLLDPSEVDPTDPGGGTGPVTPPPTPTVLTSDSFNRSDTAAGVIGTSDVAAGGQPVTPTVDSQLRIIGNAVGADTLSAPRLVRYNVGVASHAIAVNVKTVYGLRLFARIVDNSNRYEAIIGADGNLTVNRRVAGTATAIVGAAAGTFPADFTGLFKLSVQTADGGATVKVWRDSVLVASVLDANGSALAAATTVAAGSPFSTSTQLILFDNLVITDF